MKTAFFALMMLVCFTGAAAGQTTQPMRSDGGSFDQPNRGYGGYGNGRRQYQQNYDQGQGNYRRNRRSYAQAGGGLFIPASQPDVEQAVIPTPRNMTGDYLILTVRSIFSRTGAISGEQPVNAGPPGGPRERVLAFYGATRTDDVYAAYLENIDTGDITTVHVGSDIAEGKVTHISLDSLDYLSAGRTVHLAIGQNLAGEQIYGPGAAPATLPAGMVDMAGPNADILKKMMLKRQQELNGGK